MMHNYELIPSYMKENMDFYISHGWELGGFLHAVFSNDLFRAVACADRINMPLIPVYVSYIANKLPHVCHGSPEHIEIWLKKIRSQNEPS